MNAVGCPEKLQPYEHVFDRFAETAMTAPEIQKRLRQFATREKARVLQGFFKTGPGEYGEGDLFLGVVVPDIRRVAKEYQDAPLGEINKILASRYHEERLLALLMLVHRVREK